LFARKKIVKSRTGLIHALFPPQQSVENALRKMDDMLDGKGGAIAIDKNGNFGKYFNTDKMVWASIKDRNMEFGLTQGELQTERISQTC
jgi:isoaspartyl peptidase/L-asparaginase-like protein (Ntn-hydrolase superfamily)